MIYAWGTVEIATMSIVLFTLAIFIVGVLVGNALGGRR